MKLKKMRIALTTLMSVVMLAALVLTVMPISASAMDEAGYIATATKLTTADAGKTLSGDYYVEPNTSLTIRSSKAGVSGIKVKANSTLTIYIPANTKLIVYGGNASSTTGAGAGIEVGLTSTLKVIGEGTLVVYGGNGANGGAGARGDNADWADDADNDGKNGYSYIPDSGYGGPGGGGAGAGIGTKGGNGGAQTAWRLGCYGGRSQYTNNFMDYNYNGTVGHTGNAGASASKEGQIYIAATISHDVNGGSAGTAGGSGGSCGNSSSEKDDGEIHGLAGGAGGGGGGAGKAGADFGTGGGGGGSGGSGGGIGHAWSCYFIGGGGGGGGAGAVGGSGGAWSHDSQMPNHDNGKYCDGKIQSSWSGVTGGLNAGGEGGSGTRVWMRWKQSTSASWEIVSAGNGGKGGSAGLDAVSSDYKTLYEVVLVTDESTTSYFACEDKFLPVVLDSIPERAGYTFEGMVGMDGELYYDADGIRTSQYVTESTVALTASFVANSYNWDLDSESGNGGVVGGDESGSLDYDAPLQLETPTRDGYLFRGWKISAISGELHDEAYYKYFPTVATYSLRSSTGEQTSEFHEGDGFIQTAGFETIGDIITLYNLSANRGDQLKIEEVWKLDSFTVTFKDFDGRVMATQSGRYGDPLSVSIDTAKPSDYYTYTFKAWKCNIDGEYYSTEELPMIGAFLSYEAELGDAVYHDVTFTAVYDIEYKKDIKLEGSLGNNDLDADGTLVLREDSVGIDVITNFKITINDGVAAMLLIPEYDASVFSIKAVSINGVLYSLGTNDASSSEVLDGFEVEFSGGSSDIFKILIENPQALPNSTVGEEIFIQIIYTMDEAVGGEYHFGFITNTPTDTEHVTHGDRSEAYGTYDPNVNVQNDPWAFNELNIIVDSTAIKVVIQMEGKIEMDADQEVIFDRDNVEIKDIQEAIANALIYSYNGFSKMDVDTLTFTWYAADGTQLSEAPINAGDYFVVIHAKDTGFYSEVETSMISFTIKPYTIYVGTVDQTVEYTGYNADIQTGASQGSIYAKDAEGNKIDVESFVGLDLAIAGVELNGSYISANIYDDAIVGVLAGDTSNYYIVYECGTLTITQAANYWTPDPENKENTYTGSPVAISGIVSKFGTPVIEYGTVSIGADGNEVVTWSTDAPINAGVYKVRIHVEETSNFTGLDAEVELTIKKFVIPYAAFGFTADGKIYNGQEQFWTISDLAMSTEAIYAHLAEFVDLQGIVHPEDCINVKDYVIKAVLIIDNPNYTFETIKDGETVFVDRMEYDVETEIAPLELIIEIEDQANEYTGAEHTPLVNQYTITFKLPDGSIAPDYVVRDFFGIREVYDAATAFDPTATYYIEENNTYVEVTVTEETFEVNKYFTKRYLDPETLIVDKDDGVDVGAYNMTATLGSGSNYAVLYSAGIYNITKKPIELPQFENVVYNGAVQFPTRPAEGAGIYELITNGYRNAGKHPVGVTLINDNYQWFIPGDNESEPDEYTEDDQIVYWEIERKHIVVTLPDAIGTYPYGTPFADYQWENGGEIIWADADMKPFDGDDITIAWGFDPYTHITAGIHYTGQRSDPTGTDADNYIIDDVIGGAVEITKKVLTKDEIELYVEALVKYYTGEKLSMDADDFTTDMYNLIGNLVLDVDEVVSIGDDLINANGIYDSLSETFDYYDSNNKYFVEVRVSLLDTQNYEIADGADVIDVEAFIAKATNYWVDGPAIDASDISDIEITARPAFGTDEEPYITFYTDEECTNEISINDLVGGTDYYATFVVVGNSNYTSLETIGFKFSSALVQIIIPEANFGDLSIEHGEYFEIYNGLDQKFYGIVENEAYTIVYSADVWKNVGEYTVTVSLKNENGQYVWEDGKTDDLVFKLTITKASLDIWADYDEITYLDTAPTYTVSVNGLVNGETLDALLSGAIENYISCDYRQGMNAGDYTIVLSNALATELTNYDVTLTNNILRVNPKVFDYSNISDSDGTTFENLIENGLDFVYNNENKNVIAKTTPDELVVEIIYKNAQTGEIVTEIKNAGEYIVEIKVSLKDGLSDVNYDIPETDEIRITVAKAEITITVKPIKHDFTGENLASIFPITSTDGLYDITFEGAPFEDDNVTVTKIVIADGTYDIVKANGYTDVLLVEETYTASGNYIVTVDAGDFIILQADNYWDEDLNVDNDIEYDEGVLIENEDFSSLAHFGANTVRYQFYYKGSDGEWTSINGEPRIAGDYYVVATVPENTNYKELTSAPVYFTIAKQVVSMDRVIFSGYTCTYNGQDQNAWVDWFPAVLYVESYDNNSHKDVGTYTVRAYFGLYDTENYVFEDGINYKDANLVINPVRVYIEANPQSSMYGDPINELTYSAFFVGDSLATSFYATDFGEIVLTTDATSTSSVGDYVITVNYTENANYDVVSVENSTYTINRFTDNDITLSVENIEYLSTLNPIYSAERGPVIITYSIERNGTYTDVVPTQAGHYFIKATVIETENYEGGEVIAEFDIYRAKLSAVDVLTIVYNKDTATWELVATTESGKTLVGIDVLYRIEKSNGETFITLTLPEFKATEKGDFTVTAVPTDTENYEESDTVALRTVYSIEFKDSKVNHDRQDNLADLTADAYDTQLRFAGTAATNPVNIDSTAIPTVEGYNFKAWMLDGADYSFVETITDDVVLYARWQIKSYKVNLYNEVVEGNTIVDGIFAEGTYRPEHMLELEFYYKDPLVLPAGLVPEKAEDAAYTYLFAYWSRALRGEEFDVHNYYVTEKLDLYAVYGITVKEFRVTYMVSIDGKDYVEFDVIEAPYYTDLRAFENFAWFIGDGWYNDPERTEAAHGVVTVGDAIFYGAYHFDIGAGDVNADGNVTTDDIYLYRQWIVGGYDYIEVVEAGEEWDIVYYGAYDPDKTYFIKRVADANRDDSGDIRDITTIRMAITGHYGYSIVEGYDVTGNSIILTFDMVPGVSEPDKLQDAFDNSIGDEVYIKLTSDITLEDTLVLDSGKNVTINLNGYTLTLPSSGTKYGVTVKNGTLTIEGEGDVIVPGIYGLGTASDTTTGHIVINGGNFVGETAYYLFGCYNGSITINAGTFKALYCVVNNFFEEPVNHTPMTGVVTVNGGSFEVTDLPSYYPIIFLGDVDVTGPADYRIHSAENLAMAMKYGGTITLTGDVEITDFSLEISDYYWGVSNITVASGKSVELDLNGYTITQSKECNTGYVMINNLGSLTINDSVGTGKISFTDTGVGASNHGWGSYVIRNTGELVINGGTFEHYDEQTYKNNNVIFQFAGSTTINGGSFISHTSRSVRIWNGSLTITDGTFIGQVVLEDLKDNVINITCNISGGNFSPAGGDMSSVFVDNSFDGTFTVSITGGFFNTKVGASVPSAVAGFITGGTFTDAAAAGTESPLINENYSLVANGDGTQTLMPKMAE